MFTILALLLAAGPVAFPVAGPLFRNPQPIPLEEHPLSSITALRLSDFNADGRPDILVAGSGGGITVLLANGTGPFAPPVRIGILDFSGWVAIGDVNRDGHDDVIASRYTMRYSSPSVEVMLGNGDGTFRYTGYRSTQTEPGPLAIADFNGDQLPDLAVASRDQSPPKINVLFGNGRGEFSGPVSTILSATTYELTAADFNADGKADLVTGALVLLGNGDGTFTSKTEVVASGRHQVADINDDGKQDIATAAGDSVQVVLGNGDGTFGSAMRSPTGYFPISIAIADVEDDGHLDLLVSSPFGTVAVHRGRGNGTFHAAEYYLSGWTGFLNQEESQVVAADFDFDGYEDFVTSDQSLALPSLAFVRGKPGGWFEAERAYHTNPTVSASWPAPLAELVVVEDVNHDAKPDVLVSQWGELATQELVVLLNGGSGILTSPISHDSGIAGRFAAGDIDGDGELDAVIAGTGSARALLGNGDGTFDPPVACSISKNGRPALADFDGDGHLDLLIAGGTDAVVYPGEGSGTFGAGITSNVESDGALVGDLNGDGKPDFVSSLKNTVYACINDGTGRFTRSTIATGERPVEALADFDGNGTLDLLHETATGVRTRFGNGDGTFAAPIGFAIDFAGGAYDTADFDGDGTLDLVEGTNVYFGNGDGTFRSRDRVRTEWATSLRVADMDGNGTPDLIMWTLDDVRVVLTRTTLPIPTVTLPVKLISDAGVPQYGQPYKLTASVVPGTGAMPVGGVVRFDLNGKAQALIAVRTSPWMISTASFTTAFAAGVHTIAATYTGDEHYARATTSLTIDVAKAQPSMEVSGSPNPQLVQRPVHITASLNVTVPAGFPGPTGSLTIRDGETILGQIASGGSIDVATLSVGTHVITAEYAGDANFEPVSASYTQTIAKPVVDLRLQYDSPSPLYAGTSVTFHASFVEAVNLTGTLSFLVDDVVRSVVPATAAGADFQTSFTWGHHSVRAVYSGDDQWGAVSAVADLMVYIGPWGTPLEISVSATGSSLSLRWSLIPGATRYTVWVRKSAAGPWEVYGEYLPQFAGYSGSMPAERAWLFAVTGTDSNGNGTPMSALDLATSVSWTEPVLTPGVTPLRAQHILDLRGAIGIVRTFAGLPAFLYTTNVAEGEPVRALDFQQLRTAIGEARTVLGVPAAAVTDATLTPGVTPVRAQHVRDLRAGVD